ncbi:MAG TPA: hypothetical protein V6C71_13035 [Coleofasciculaceae cyanobacterium]
MKQLPVESVRDMGCDRGQGYLISKLLERDSLDHFLLGSTNR